MKASLAHSSESKSHIHTNDVSPKTINGKSIQLFTDNRSETVTQRRLKEMANSGETVKSTVQLQSIFKQPVQREAMEEEELLQGKFEPIQLQQPEEEELIQGKFKTVQRQGLEEEELLQGKFKTTQRREIEEEEPLQGKFMTLQRQSPEEEELLQGKFAPIQKKGNNAGLPDNLKSGIENLSGVGMDDVNVHYNSDKPAGLQAHAYAQGTDIHIAPGQEKHLPHEAWHVVQQKQGRVKPTMQLKGNVNVNDDKGLEKEADVMGEKALLQQNENPASVTTQLFIHKDHGKQGITQRRINFTDDISSKKIKNIHVSSGGSQGVLFIDDGGSPPIVIKPEVGSAREAIEAANFTNAMISDQSESGWKVGAPRARLATLGEVNHIVNAINNPKGPKKNGDPARIANILQVLQNSPGEIVVYENAGGDDFLNYLATGPDKNDAGKKQTKKGTKTRKGSGLAQLESPAYCKQLGRAAATDIFLGNDDRLSGKGNFENWRSDAQKKSIALVDNIIFSNQAMWKARQDVTDFAKENYNAIADTIATEIVDLMKHGGYGGGKARDKDHAMIDNIKTNVIEPNIAEGLKSGRLLLMQRGWSYVVKMGDLDPKKNLFRDRLEFINNNGK